MGVKCGLVSISFRQHTPEEILAAMQQAGLSVTKVKEYYTERVTGNIRKGKDESEEFYLKVKNILDEEGEISNVLGRLTDKEVYLTLSYEEQQRYSLELSEKYLKAVERYKKEKAIMINAN